MKRDTHLNVIGPEIRRIRKQRGWSQSKLALRLQSVGWNISRSGLAKIECRIMWVGDFELLYFVRASRCRNWRTVSAQREESSRSSNDREAFPKLGELCGLARRG